MPFVSDASPLIAFARANRLKLIQETLGSVIVPRAVYEEVVVDGEGRSGASAVEDATWIYVDDSEPPEQTGVRRVLSAQDRAVLALALSHSASILTDDLALRKEARERGVDVVGCLGLLQRAKERGLVAEALPILDELLKCGYRLSQKLYDDWSTIVGEGSG